MDFFLVFAYQDAEYAGGLEDTLAGRGLVVGEVALVVARTETPAHDRPGAPRRPPRGRGRLEGVPGVLVVPEGTGRSDDPEPGRGGPLGPRRGGRGEAFPRLAVAAFPGSLSERLVRLLRPEDEGE